MNDVNKGAVDDNKPKEESKEVDVTEELEQLKKKLAKLESDSTKSVLDGAIKSGEDKAKKLIEEKQKEELAGIKRRIFAEAVAKYIYKMVPYCIGRFSDNEEEKSMKITLQFFYKGAPYGNELAYKHEEFEDMDEKRINERAYEEAKKFIHLVFERLVLVD